MITSFETIEHVKDYKKALSELYRVLKPNGLIVISNPNRKLTSPFKSINEPPDNPFHIVEHTTEEFIQIIENQFVNLGVYGQRGINKLFFMPFIERILRKKIHRLYSPEKGKSDLKKVSFTKEYRYSVIVGSKSNP